MKRRTSGASPRRSPTRRAGSLAGPSWQTTLARLLAGSEGSLDRALTEQTLEDSVVLVQRAARRLIQRHRLQRATVQKAVAAQRAAKREAANNDHVIADMQIDVVKDLSAWTLERACSAFNAKVVNLKPALMRSLGSGVQLLLASLEAVASLGGHSTVPALEHAIQVALTSLLNASNVTVVRVVDGGVVDGAAGLFPGGRAFQLGTELRVPLSALPVAKALLASASRSSRSPARSQRIW